VWTDESPPEFQRNVSPSYSGSMNKPSKKLLGLHFDPENEGDIFLRNVGRLSLDSTKLYPRRQNFSHTAERTSISVKFVIKAYVKYRLF
jgi:hypothetical protein